MARFSKFILPFVAGSICIARPGHLKNKAVIHELRAMTKADQVSRTLPETPDHTADEARQQRVLDLLANGQIKNAEAQECAALILQHSSLAICDGSLRAVSRDNYLLAYLLAKSAAEKGRKSARRLAADALDRFLVFSGKPQKYGTQTVLDLKTKKMVIPPIDPKTTDEDRAKWDVEPLSQILRRVEDEKL